MAQNTNVSEVGTGRQHHHELSPLLLDQSSSVIEENETPSSDRQQTPLDAASNKASRDQTILNLMKTCMGTGCLALSYACQQGGWLIFTAGAFTIASWNVFCVQRLCLCLKYIPVEDEVYGRDQSESDGVVAGTDSIKSGSSHNEQQHLTQRTSSTEDRDFAAAAAAGGGGNIREAARAAEYEYARLHPPRGISTLGRVAWYAYGRTGLILIDAMMILLLIGVIVSYVAAAISFLDDTPLSLGALFNAILVSGIMACISIVPHVGYLSRFSALGLSILFATLLVIASYGFVGSRRIDYESEATAIISSSNATPAAATPAVVQNIHVWPVSFTGLSQWFGVIVFGYGVVPLTYNYRESMAEPTRMVPATMFALMAVSCLYIIIGVGLLLLFPDLTGDVLHELPRHGLLPVFTRLAMVFVILMTAPLLIVPCGELLEGQWQTTQRVPVRFGIMIICVVIAISVPGFVKVLSLVGSACVGTVSLILPPLLHRRLSSLAYLDHDDGHNHTLSQWVDTSLLAAGIVVTVISTLLVLKY